MNLDDRNYLATLDSEDMLGHIRGLPDQLQNAWSLGMSQTMEPLVGVEQVLIAGMGGSAIGGDLLAAFLRDRIEIPISVCRNYNLPAWAKGEKTLVIASSHSGNTEETLAAVDEAIEHQCQILAITTGGTLAEKAAEAGAMLWKFEHKGQPRAAVGFSFGLLLAALVKSGLVSIEPGEVEGAVQAMRTQQADLEIDTPVVKNPAKRQAGQLMGRYVAVFGSDLMEPVARRWKTQINENSKAWAQFEFLPEADHNTLAGIVYPEELMGKISAFFLQSDYDHPRNLKRSKLTRDKFLLEGIMTDTYKAKGDSALEQMWTALHFGDYVSFYLGIAYGVDPTPVDALQNLKQALKS